MKFYVLEFVVHPGLYYIDNQLGYTDDVLMAERYTSPKGALKYKKNKNKWIVRTVTVTVS